MKTFVIGILAAGVAAGATYMIVANKPSGDWSAERAKLEAAFETEKAKLQADLARERKRSGRVDTVEVEVSSALAPDEIITRLKGLVPDTGARRTRSLREVMYLLESLAAHKEAAVPAIRQFFALNEDIPYNFNERGNNDNAPQAAAAAALLAQGRPGGQGGGPGGRQGGGGPGGGGQFGQFGQGGRGGGGEVNPSLEFFLPPSLRIGLLDVLRDIGGAQAEAALVEVLTGSARGVEIALAAKALETLTPGKYTAMAVAAPKELIPNLPEIDNPDRLDRNAKGYLYGILKDYNDASFVDTAQTLLVTPNGQIDRNALDYLTAMLKGDVTSALMQAYNDPRITNQWAKAPLAQQILSQVGANAQANELLYKIVSDPEQQPMAKTMAIASLAGGGGRGPFGGGDNDLPTDPAILQSRIQVLSTIQQTVDPNDQMTMATIQFTQNNLTRLLNGQEPANPREMLQQMGGGFGGRGQGGQGGFGGGGGQGGRRGGGGGGGGR